MMEKGDGDLYFLEYGQVGPQADRAAHFSEKATGKVRSFTHSMLLERLGILQQSSQRRSLTERVLAMWPKE